ncbi:MAG: ABC transporter permease, partial [Vulcanimicrobiaceae bacterium]
MTRFLAYLSEAFASLWRNRVRSVLTMLGMIIGSASIITVFGISKAATSGIAASFDSFGQSPLLVQVDRSQDYPDQAQIQYRDTPAVAAALGDTAASVIPNWTRTYPIVSGGKRDYISVQSDGPYHTDKLVMAEGHEISQDEVDSGARVAVLTQDVATEFFGSQPAVGNYLRINGGRYLVSGVYADIEGSFFNSLAGSSTIVVPYTTFYNDLYTGPPDFLLLYPRDPLASDATGKAASCFACQSRRRSRAATPPWQSPPRQKLSQAASASVPPVSADARPDLDRTPRTPSRSLRCPPGPARCRAPFQRP